MKKIIKFIKSRRSEAATAKLKQLGREVANFAIDKAITKAKGVYSTSFTQGRNSALAFGKVVKSNPIATAVIVTSVVFTVFALQRAFTAEKA